MLSSSEVGCVKGFHAIKVGTTAAAAEPPAVDGAKGDAQPGKVGQLPPAKPTVQPGGPKSPNKPVDPNAKTAEGKSVKELQDEATKKGKKPEKEGLKPVEGAEVPSENKDEGKEAPRPGPAELPLSMLGAAHRLILTAGAPPRLELESKRDLLSNKIGRAVGKIMKVSPGNTAQIEELKWIGGLAKKVQAEAIRFGNDPRNKLRDVPGFDDLKNKIEAYGKTWKTEDIEEYVADPESLRDKIQDLLSKADHKSPAVYSRGKHWKGTSEYERRESSEDGDGQFMYRLSPSDVKDLERDAFLKGEIEAKGSGGYWAYKTFSSQIGYADGKDAFLLRAEMTNVGSGNPSIHSHPRLSK